MDRQTLAQALAALVMLAALVRWLPPGGPDDVLGRGDAWSLRPAVAQVLAEPDSDLPAAMLRTSVGANDPRREKIIRHWMELIALERELLARAQPGDVVQVRNLARNDMWTLAFDLYPLRVIGQTLEEGSRRDAAVLPEADWVLTGCALAPKTRCSVEPAAAARGKGP
jgi:hypothetical protein